MKPATEAKGAASPPAQQQWQQRWRKERHRRRRSSSASSSSGSSSSGSSSGSSSSPVVGKLSIGPVADADQHEILEEMAARETAAWHRRKVELRTDSFQPALDTAQGHIIRRGYAWQAPPEAPITVMGSGPLQHEVTNILTFFKRKKAIEERMGCRKKRRRYTCRRCGNSGHSSKNCPG